MCRFEVAFAALLINNLSSVHSPGANCEKDSCKIFTALNSLFFDKINDTSSCTVEVNFEHINGDSLFVSLEEKKNNPKIKVQLEYVTGYVLKNQQILMCNMHR